MEGVKKEIERMFEGLLKMEPGELKGFDAEYEGVIKEYTEEQKRRAMANAYASLTVYR